MLGSLTGGREKRLELHLAESEEFVVRVSSGNAMQEEASPNLGLAAVTSGSGDCSSINSIMTLGRQGLKRGAFI